MLETSRFISQCFHYNPVPPLPDYYPWVSNFKPNNDVLSSSYRLRLEATVTVLGTMVDVNMDFTLLTLLNSPSTIYWQLSTLQCITTVVAARAYYYNFNMCLTYLIQVVY